MNNPVLIALIIGFLLFDFAWISANKLSYNSLVENVQKSRMTTKIFPALLSYALMVLGYVAILLPLLERKRDTIEGKHPIQLLLIALRYGGVFGLVVYGIFNTTNMAIFNNYDASIALKDTLWGSFVYTMLCFATLLLMQVKYI